MPSDPHSAITGAEAVTLADWRRRVAELYATTRAAPDPERAWEGWCATRRRLFRQHPQSPVPASAREGFAGPSVFPYEPAARTTADLRAVDPEVTEIATSVGGQTRFLLIGDASFEILGRAASLEVYWLDAYGGGLFLSFRDETSGTQTYGGGRYLLDTVKGADLGTQDGRLVLDFNFAYQPSCSYDPRWACPLPPPANRLPFPVPAGERLA
jgi:uncharacterized protein (DUF1684 family)